MRRDVRRWFEARTYPTGAWSRAAVLDAKRSVSVAVVLPALDEEATVGHAVREVREHLLGSLVDELVVMDSGSTDRTAAVAAAAGARVVHRDDVLPSLGSRPGKGDVLWKSLHATTSDVVVFVDSDVESFAADHVTALVGPLLADPGTMFVKAAYDRPLGRVTELVARPLLNTHWPSLAGFVQPLAGEYAARRDLLERLPFPCGYGVELGLLVDTLLTCGLDAMAQVDLGRRVHRHQPDDALGRMASEIWRTALVRLDRTGRVRLRTPLPAAYTGFVRTSEGFEPVSTEVPADERPPMLSVPAYAARRARAS